MSEMQLSFLSTEPTAFDVNAVDDGLIHISAPHDCAISQALAHRAVDDCVFGLGFTNWKCLIDHALLTGHFDLYEADGGHLGLRKHGYKHAPIPRLPAGAASYIQHHLLTLASDRSATAGRHERMISVASDFAHKCEIADGVCNLTVKQAGVVIRTTVQVQDLIFSDTKANDTFPLAKQLERILVLAGAEVGETLTKGCKSLAAHILQVPGGLR